MFAAMKKRWVKALRSGDYEQGRGALHSADGKFCCLGVLCDIEIEGDWELDSGAHSYDLPYGKEYASFELPRAFRKEKKISIGNQDTLMDLNDGDGFKGTEGKSFEEIADWIEEKL